MPFTYKWVTSFSYFLTQVMHSMRLNEKLFQPWVVISLSGVAETCTHVGALLFKIEAVVRVRERPLCHWCSGVLDTPKQRQQSFTRSEIQD